MPIVQMPEKRADQRNLFSAQPCLSDLFDRGRARSNIPGGVKHNGIAARKAGGGYERRDEPRGPAKFFEISHQRTLVVGAEQVVMRSLAVRLKLPVCASWAISPPVTVVRWPPAVT